MASFDQTAATAAQNLGAKVEDDALDANYNMIVDNYPEGLDYYALLGLSQKPPPTEAEIRSVYRNLSLSFHPDKQPPHLREAAQKHFTRIQEAYDALIDPQKRIVYDMLGAEGVKQEWGHRGAMGTAGEAEKQEVGVKTMSPDEFRQWFLKTMKKRERKAVQSLVESSGTITLGVNAEDIIQVDGDDVTFGIPSPKITTFGASYEFKAPLPLPEFLSRKDENEDDESEAQDQDQPAGLNELEETEDPVYVTINAGINGGLARQKRTYLVTYEGREDEEVAVKVDGPRLLVSNEMQLGATIAPNFRALAGRKGILSWRPFTFLQDSTVLVEGVVLPERLVKTTIARSIQPISGIKPFSVTASSIIKYPLLEAPPSFEIQASKEIAPSKVAFFSWSSGSWQWPDLLLDRFSSLGMYPNTMYASEDELSGFQIGLLSLPKTRVKDTIGDGDEDDDDELAQISRKERNIDRARESWVTQLQVSPGGGGLVLKYERNLFSGKPSDDPVRSEWSGVGYFPMKKMEGARAVRLAITTVLAPDLSVSWTVQGTRRVSEYTKLGLAIGIAHKGIHMSVSWERLGQGINIPVILCPARQATHEAAMLATVVPWLAYCAVEFGYIRPRDRKKRRQAAARRHNELKKLIPKKRAESQQAIELMADQVLRRQTREEAQDGLVITKAEYGYVPGTSKKLLSKFPDPRLVDVTIPVAALVDRSQLVIPENTIKFQIIGFHDPAPLLPKRLKIWYTFQGREHFIDVGDKEGFSCPMRAHLVSS
ncbi:uncharacterized protein N7483_000971 [Penicillium malachiteum]|uniref:uncharacterized protein n=1 Tax=Penicillium malachiteum TaxID=1324776 RepID=UPI002549B7F5|nr:uncharacterized protein N7483_000971 [Penicillium malachiteum]KAJ5735846.1 hypothetical protein N7483_000971 [Penicillium malachiteum]